MTTAQFATLALFAIVFTVINLFGLLYHFGNRQSVEPFHPRQTPKQEPVPKSAPGRQDAKPQRESPPTPPLRRAA